MTVNDFENALGALLGEIMVSNVNTPTQTIAEVMRDEAQKLDDSGTRFMWQMLPDETESAGQP